MSTSEKPTISVEQIKHRVSEMAASMDEQCAVNFGKLTGLRGAKLANLTREHQRLEKAHGSENPLTKALYEKIQANAQFQTLLELETTRASIDSPEADADIWILHGQVYSKEFKAMPKLYVGLYDKTGVLIDKFGYVRTNLKGYFKLSGSSEISTPRKNDESTESSDKSKTVPVFIGVSDQKKELLYVDKEPVFLEFGRSVYREIILADEENTGRVTRKRPKKESVRK